MARRALGLCLLATLASVAALRFPVPGFAGARKPPPAATQLRDALLAADSEPLDRVKIDGLVSDLSAMRVPFQGLGGGLWRACYTQGETPRWEKYARALPGVRSMNKAGQSYDAPNGLVENYGEIIGRAVHFTASGAFTEVDGATRCPKDFDVQIAQGGLVLFGLPLVSSAISGPGALRVLYADDDIRIFTNRADSPDRWESEGLVVVQVRDELFA